VYQMLGMLDAVPEDLRKTLDAPLLSPAGYTKEVPRLLKDTVTGNDAVKLQLKSGANGADFVRKNMDNPYVRSQVEKTFRKQIGSEAGQRMFRDAFRIEAVPNLLPSKHTALTPNLYATNKRVADDILEVVGKTDEGSYLSRLSNQAVESLETTNIGRRDKGISGVQAEPKPYVKLTDEQADKLKTITDQYASMYKGRQDLYTLLQDVQSKRISLEDIRLLQDLHIESVGRAQFPTKVSSPEQIAKFQDTYVYNELVKPVDIRRGFIVNTINKAVREIAGKMGVEGAALVKTDPRLLTILDETQQRAASIAKQLPIEIRDVKQSPEARAFYGLPTTGELTDKQVMVRLLTGTAKDEEMLHGLVQQIQDLVVVPKVSKRAWWERPFKMIKKDNGEMDVLRLTAVEGQQRALATNKLRAAIAKDPDGLAEHLSTYIEELSSLKANDSVSVLSTKTSTEELLAALYLNRAANIANQEAIQRIVDLEPKQAFREIATVATKLTERMADNKPGAYVYTPTEIHSFMISNRLKEITGNIPTYPSFDMLPLIFKQNMSGGGMKKIVDEVATKHLSKQQYAFLDETISTHAWHFEDTYKLGDMTEDIDLWKYHWEDGVKYAEPDTSLGEQLLDIRIPTKMVGYEHIEKLLNAPKALENIAEFMHSTQASPIYNAAKKLLSTLKETQYTMMLTLRPRFHGANILTAPFIMYGNMGGYETLRSLNKGAQLAAMVASGRTAKKAGIPSKALVIDKAGRQYTYEEVADMMRRGGLQQSQVTSYVNPSDVEKLTEVIDPRLLQRAATSVKEFAATTDSMFRASVLVQKLEDGLPPAQAIRQAREALFDYGRMTDAEKKYLGSWWAFYSFTRASSLNLLEQVVTNPQRVKNSIRFSKGFLYL